MDCSGGTETTDQLVSERPDIQFPLYVSLLPHPRSVCLDSIRVYKLTCIVTSSLLSYGISQSLLQNGLSEVVTRAKDARLPRDPGGGGLMVLDNAKTDHSTDLVNVQSDEERMREELRNLGSDRRRTRWGKGRGLDGEVEEEVELRDTFFRPGVPRRDG